MKFALLILSLIGYAYTKHNEQCLVGNGRYRVYYYASSTTGHYFFNWQTEIEITDSTYEEHFDNDDIIYGIIKRWPGNKCYYLFHHDTDLGIDTTDPRAKAWFQSYGEPLMEVTQVNNDTTYFNIVSTGLLDRSSGTSGMLIKMR